MTGQSVRVVAVSPVLPHLLDWLEHDPEARQGQQDAWVAGWEACEQANGLPPALFDPGADDGR